jgi:multidrug efflux pump subunit AcrA (membrane-fusion protein)
MNRRRIVQFGIALALVAGAFFGARAGWAALRPQAAGIPTARVLRGEVDTSIHATGELKSTKTTTLTAPAVGGQLRLVTLKPTGAAVTAGEIVMAFDPSDQENKLLESRAELLEADLEIEKLNVDNAVQIAQDKVDLLTARFDVRKAELDITGNELLSAIKARQNELTLEEARRRLAQLDEDVKSHATTSQAAMAVLAEKRNKAQLAMTQAQQTIESMIVRAKADGIIAVSPNRDGMNFGYPGMVVPDYREGDNVSSGRQVAELLDSSAIEFVARVPETERQTVATGQKAMLTLDGLAAAQLGAKVTNVGVARAGMGFFRGPEGPVRLVDVSLALDKPMTTARPGLTAKVRIASDPLKNVLYVPRQAIFDKDGTSLVYLKVGDRFEARPVTIAARTETAVVISGLTEGAEIALSNPDQKNIQKNQPQPAVSTPARAGI